MLSKDRWVVLVSQRRRVPRFYAIDARSGKIVLSGEQKIEEK